MSTLRSVAPVLATADLTRWLDHYRALGFTVECYDDGYGFARLDGVELHVSVLPGHDPARTAGCAYLHVEDADVLHARWSPVPGGRDVPPVDTPYGLREGAHLDPDGNLLRYGSPLRG
ncbi:bleomycin resistance protein [Pseudonocardia spirodelae]|uniref:Bleomycin resistance protein n=1 Tax=Pseudonocardia spirodelae TaxID=3133431 RepID=A0ABU8T8Z4_9PSEU